MCRNIRQLRFSDRSPTEEELELAALQFVRKITGYRKPSRANEEAFESAVSEIASVTQKLLADLVIK